jgi:hypothetical protein
LRYLKVYYSTLLPIPFDYNSTLLKPPRLRRRGTSIMLHFLSKPTKPKKIMEKEALLFNYPQQIK